MCSAKRKSNFRFLSISLLLSIALLSALLLYIRRAAKSEAEISSYRDSAEYVFRGDYNFVPFEFVNRDGKPDGYNIDVINAVAKAANINVRIDLGRWDVVRKELEDRHIDGLCGMFYSEERSKKVEFTQPITSMSCSIFALKKSGIKSYKDILNKRIIVQKSSREDDFAIENKLTDKLIEELDWEKVLPRLAAGEADCALFLTFQGINMLREPGLKGIILIEPPLLKESYSIAVSKDEPYLLFKLNWGLKKILESGELEKIRNKWFGASAPADGTLRKFIRYLTWVTAPLILAVLFFFLWTTSLKRQVAAKTAELLEALVKREKTQEELLKTKLYYQCIINAMPSILIGIDLDMMIVNMNWEAEKLSGQNSRDAFKKSFGDVFPDYAEFMDDIKDAVRQKILFSKQKTFFSLDKRRTVMMVNAYPLFAEAAAGAVIRIDDITDRTRFEEMVIQTEKMLSVGGLAAGMAHEINNPLGIIIQGADNIERRLFSDIPGNVQAAGECGVTIDQIRGYANKRAIAEFLNDIKDGGQRASKIVSGMLQFRRGQDGDFSVCNLPTLIKESVALAASDYDLKKKYDFAGIQIDPLFDPEAAEVTCLPSQIKHVFVNILKNSVQAISLKKYSKKELPSISIKTMRNNDMIDIIFEDNGPGMDNEVERRIFEPFYTTHDVGDGTGLGLFVAYSIITEKHGGTIVVDSQKDKFTRFTIKLPVEHRSDS